LVSRDFFQGANHGKLGWSLPKSPVNGAIPRAARQREPRRHERVARCVDWTAIPGSPFSSPFHFSNYKGKIPLVRLGKKISRGCSNHWWFIFQIIKAKSPQEAL